MKQSELLANYRRTFLGACLGIGLLDRGPDDNHVCFQLLVEDDENWFAGHNNGYSSFWLPDLTDQITEAMAWIKQNCTEEIGGWRFKDADPDV